MSGFRSRRLKAGLTLVAGALAALASASAASAQPPPNDNRSGAELTSGTNVNLFRDNIEATPNNNPGEPGEDLSCGASPINSTVWFSYDPPAAGTAVYTVASGAQATGDGDGGEPGDDGVLDAVIQLYDANGQFQTCSDAFLRPTVTAFYGANNPPPVLLQVGGFAYGVGTFFEWGVFTYTVNFSPATRVSANFKYRYRNISEDEKQLTKAAVSAENGTTIEVDCVGSDCFKGTKTYTRSPVNLLKLLPRRIDFGTAIDVFVTEPGRYGYYARLKIKAKPRKLSRCLAAGDTDPVRADISPCPG